MKKKQKLNLHPISEKAVIGGATMFVEKMKQQPMAFKGDKPYMLRLDGVNTKLLEIELPYKIGDIVFIPEDFNCSKCIWYCNNGYCEHTDTKVNLDAFEDCDLANTMTFEQARYKYEITDIKIVRVQDMYFTTWENNLKLIKENTNILNVYERTEDSEWQCDIVCKAMNIDYNSNEYIALYTIKEIK